MKKFGLTLMAAFVGGAIALGAYKVIENKYALRTNKKCIMQQAIV
jgi:hypothetical protein